MAYQAFFQRYEYKYLLTRRQKEKILQALEPYMALDAYGRTTIRNIYFDTDNYRLIRHSIERTGYKEKLRIRSYAKAKPDSMVFVELKRKYDSIVYKRRLSLEEKEAVEWVVGQTPCKQNSQIANEIDYFLDYYKTLHPVAFLSYEREAFCERAGGDFRVTFDDGILCRQEELSLEGDIWGIPLLPEDCVLMELKCAGGIPLWMTDALSKERIFRTSFSKYGTAYQTIIYPQMKGN
ncbi:MAG: polyphosphate polymerase domain-containing protein [Clostridiales bacterium]|nr:polyphosphate polymerase domain-containing protein [Clostridiales bacterium]